MNLNLRYKKFLILKSFDYWKNDIFEEANNRIQDWRTIKCRWSIEFSILIILKLIKINYLL